jgi:general secretion pathway protein D
MTVMNNQTAILKVAENEVFFELDVEREEDDDDDNDTEDILSIDSEIRTLPIGLVLAVQPAINLQRNRVTLTLRPTITRVQRFANDPAVAILSDNQVQSQVPVVQTRELDSVLEIQSGNIAVLGGLMQERTENRDTGLPGLSEVPWLGRVFKSRTESTDMVELVVLLRARIAPSPRPDAADRRLYDDFTHDPRPFPLPEGRGRGGSRRNGN